MYYVYCLQTENNSYIGCTSNLKERLRRHKARHIAFTRNHLFLSLKFYIAIPHKHTAYRLEKYFKTGSGRVFIKRHF